MVVNPNTASSMTEAVVSAAARVAAAGTMVLGSTASRGVPAIESNVDEVWGALGVLEQVRAGEERGVDGYVIACFGDTGLAAAKEAARGPAVGMTEAALFTAALVAARFAIITLPPRTREQSRRVLRDTGLERRATVRAIDVGVTDLAAGTETVLEAMLDEGRRAIVYDSAEAVVLGCAGLADLVAPLQQELAVPVIDGVTAAVKAVEGLLAQGLSTSRAGTYARTADVER
ncbi:MAG: aspartate/glutamate racemase family protein [Acidobacteriota bacterium]|nr:aspartate/glutamate racemase family protein [Acidobacteriota bacterium]